MPPSRHTPARSAIGALAVLALGGAVAATLTVAIVTAAQGSPIPMDRTDVATVFVEPFEYAIPEIMDPAAAISETSVLWALAEGIPDAASAYGLVQYEAPETGARGVLIADVTEAVAHPCPGVDGGRSRVDVGDGPTAFVGDMQMIAGLALEDISESTLDSRPATAAMSGPNHRCETTDIHLPGFAPNGNIQLAVPSRIIVAEVAGSTILVQAWAGTPEALEEWLPIADEFIDSIHFLEPQPAEGATTSSSALASAPATDEATPAPLSEATAVSAGDYHTCAIVEQGRVACWGTGTSGQLGDGMHTDGPKAVQVEGIVGATVIAAGADNTCALVSDSSAMCWGFNANGEIVGTPSVGGDEPLADALVPTEFPALRGATAIAMRGNVPCGLLADGSVTCRERPGEDPDLHVRHDPLTSRSDTGIANARSVVAGDGHACALLADGKVACWGDIRYGSLAGPRWHSSTPVIVEEVEHATLIAAGGGYACAAEADGRILCWGREGERGEDDASTTGLVASEVARLPDVTAMSLRGGHACALTRGRVACWGSNGYGQLGDGTRSDSAVPVEVAGLTGVVGVTTGADHTCAVIDTGEVRCWGSDELGQLGDGSSMPQGPTSVRGLTGVTSLSAGDGHSCALLSGGDVRCWGANVGGQVGDGSFTNRLEPVDVVGLDGVTALSSGHGGTCAIVAAGGVRCWGRNDGGQLGDGGTNSDGRPVDVRGIEDATAVASTFDEACAVIADGTVRCWGGSYGRDGDAEGTTASAPPEPVTIAGIGDATALAGGVQHFCALVGGGHVRCWGYNGGGQLGAGPIAEDGTVSDPVEVPDLAGAVGIAAGYEQTCALVADGRVRCWGADPLDPSYPPRIRLEPVVVPGIDDAVAISGAGRTSCVLLSVGTVDCWGSDYAGLLGDGSTQDSAVPVEVSGVEGATGLTLGWTHGCAVVPAGEVRCWGADDVGQLGDGSDGPVLATVLSTEPMSP